MMKTLAFALPAGALALPVAAAAAPQVTLQPTGPVVELSVYESVDVAPDTVTIGAGVTTSAATASEALRLNAAAMQSVIARIKALGIAPKDIQTTGINLNPQYDYDQASQRQVFRGYQASNRVSVILRKIEDTGKVLDALVAAGATDLSGPSFSIADDTVATGQARARAVARADAQARAYAAMLGYQGARVLAISEGLAAGPRPYEMAKGRNFEAQAAAAPVEPGMVAAGVSVTVTYELTGTAGNPAG
ncbi:SIMPL domain-containing protein [Erythrobacter sp. NE805]|uniref:SIMPL domain-containing protein n=1 Tax=Erythrobacter sp. NE805 TaxID=3389875 RepID=UPI00396AF1BD